MQFEVITATATRFQYGYLDAGGYFLGITIVGTGLTYEAGTVQPVSGTVKTITETSFDPLNPSSPAKPELISLRQLPVTDVAALNAAGVNWFDENASLDMATAYPGVLMVLGGQSDQVSGWTLPGLNLVAGAGNDRIIGTAYDDVINGAGWDDFLAGGDGNDSLYGGSDNDVLSGDDGNDYLNGGGGADSLFGGNHDDVLLGDGGNDTLYGDNQDGSGIAGNDKLRGGSGNDYLWGGGGNDRLYGDNDNDTLYGGAGNDKLYGGNGDDQLWGNDGLPGSTGKNRLDGGAGNDLLVGGSDNDQLIGGTGNDTLDGALGNDLMKGGDGDDHFGGTGGRDYMIGGAGADTFYFLDEGVTGSATVADFTLGEDQLDINYGAGLTAQEEFDLFLGNAVQVNGNVVWTNAAGDYVTTLLNLDLATLTVDDFI